MCSSVIGLICLDHVPVVGQDIGASGEVRELPGVVLDGKLDSFELRRRVPIMEARELPEDVIEGASEVVDCVPNYEPKCGEDGLGVGHALNAEDVVARLRVDLGVDWHSVGFLSDDLAEAVVEGVAVQYRVLKLRPGAGQGG